MDAGARGASYRGSSRRRHRQRHDWRGRIAPGWSASIDAAYRDPDSGVLPQFEIIVLSGGRRIIEFDHLNADDNRYVTEMIEGTIIQIGSHTAVIGSR